MCVIGFLLVVDNMEKLQVACYIMFGFGYSTSNDLCCTVDIAVKKHCFPPYDLHKLKTVHPLFQDLCWSAISDKVPNSMNDGRLFGGLSILIREKFWPLYI